MPYPAELLRKQIIRYFLFISEPSCPGIPTREFLEGNSHITLQGCQSQVQASCESQWDTTSHTHTQFNSVQSLRRVQLFATPWTAARQASLSITSSWSFPKLMPIELVMLSSHLILCHPLLLPSICPSIRVFSNKSVLHIRWPKYWSFSFNISSSNVYSGLIPFRIDWFDLFAVQGALKSLL